MTFQEETHSKEKPVCPECGGESSPQGGRIDAEGPLFGFYLGGDEDPLKTLTMTSDLSV